MSQQQTTAHLLPYLKVLIYMHSYADLSHIYNFAKVFGVSCTGYTHASMSNVQGLSAKKPF